VGSEKVHLAMPDKAKNNRNYELPNNSRSRGQALFQTSLYYLDGSQQTDVANKNPSLFDKVSGEDFGDDSLRSRGSLGLWRANTTFQISEHE
jgi:hypothetical protein